MAGQLKNLTRPCVLLLCMGLALPLTLAGCGNSGTVTVAGRVTYNGQPVKTGIVRFHPDAGRGNTSPHIPSGHIDEQGNYALMTTPETKGVAPGWYKVIVISAPWDPSQGFGRARSLIPRRYNDVEKSGLAIEVVADAPPGTYDLKLRD